MSTTKHITQGGQVFSYMLNMFLQVNKRVAFWLINTYLILVPLIFWVRVPWQEIRNGGLYWWLYFTAAGEKALYLVPPVYDIPWDGKILHFTSAHILRDPYMQYAGKLTLQECYLALFVAACIVGAIAAAVFAWLKHLGEQQAKDEVVGGRTLSDDVKAVARLMSRNGEASPLRFDGLPLMLGTEVQNILLHGTPGSGKSNWINKLLKQLRASGDMVIVYDKGCSLVKRHFNENTDKLLNPRDKRCENWDLWKECESTPDYDRVGNTVIPQGPKEDPFWTGSARTIFTAVSRRMKKDPERSYTRLLRTLLAIDLKALREYIDGTEAANLTEEKVEKTAISIRGVLTNYVKALRYLQGIERSGKPPFAIREWMKRVNDPAKENGWLWITSNAREHESLKPLISMWLAQAASCLMEMGENPTRRVWFIYDELYSLHKLPELPNNLSEGRKFGSCFVIGLQSKFQQDVLYGPEGSTVMMDLYNSRIFFRSPDEQVASYVMRQLGQERVNKFHEQYSYGAETVRDGVSFSKQREDQYLVNYSDIQSLPDLQCYVTLPGKYPVVHMNMRYEKMKFVAPELIPRELKDNLDEEIEAELTKRDAEAGSTAGLISQLFGEAGPEVATVAVAPAVSDATLTVSVASVVPAPAAVVPAAPSALAVVSATTSETPTDSGGRVVEQDGLLIDTATGEVMEPVVEHDDYAEYQREALQAMQEEEKNILTHSHEREDEIEEYDASGGRW